MGEIKEKYWRSVEEVGDFLLNQIFKFKGYEYLVSEVKVDMLEQDWGVGEEKLSILGE